MSRREERRYTPPEAQGEFRQEIRREEQSPKRRPVRAFFRWFGAIVLILCIAFCAKTVWPYVDAFFFSNSTTKWVSEKFSEKLHEQNKLVVYEAEIAGSDTVTQDAWLIGTVQSVTVPYTFQISYTVDLSKAEVSVENREIIVRIPSPVADYHKLIVDESTVQKTDWLHPLTAQRYAEIKGEMEQRMFEEYSTNSEILQNAQNGAKENLRSLFSAFTEENQVNQGYTLQVLISDAAN